MDSVVLIQCHMLLHGIIKTGNKTRDNFGADASCVESSEITFGLIVPIH